LDAAAGVIIPSLISQIAANNGAEELNKSEKHATEDFLMRAKYNLH